MASALTFYFLAALAVAAAEPALRGSFESPVLSANRTLVEGKVSVQCSVTCMCKEPMQGTVGHNGYICSEPRRNAWCASNEACISTQPFCFGDWATACRVVALKAADTLGASSENHAGNGNSTDMAEMSVAEEPTSPGNSTEAAKKSGAEQPANAKDGFVVEEETAAVQCDVVCMCDTPFMGTSGHNRYTCSIPRLSAWCASNEACATSGTFCHGNWATACRRVQ